MATENTDCEREAKKLRSSEPDLKVVLGSGDAESIQWHHSQTLASKSKYIDAMLSTPMKEKDEYIISFPDIDPETWQKMMKYIENLVAARQMNARDALDVALFYDKYEFVEGGKLCDQVIVDYFKSINILEKNFTLDLDLIIDLVNVAHKANFDAATKEGINYIYKKLNSVGTPYGRMMFTEEHLIKLAPILQYSRDNWERMGLINGETSRLINDLDQVSENFPKQFVSDCKSWEEYDLLKRCISHIELSGSKCKADGNFEKDMNCWDVYSDLDERTYTWGGETVTFRIQYWEDDSFEGWAIVRRTPPILIAEDGESDDDGELDYDSIVETRCWIAPYSKNRKRPPLRGWVSSDPMARGNPTIKYVLRESIG